VLDACLRQRGISVQMAGFTLEGHWCRRTSPSERLTFQSADPEAGDPAAPVLADFGGEYAGAASAHR
jgi:hypothetical protein